MDKKIPVELSGLGSAAALSLILCLLSATIIYCTSLSEALLGSVGKIILIIAVFWGGCYVSKAHGSKGLVRGINMGIVFFILMLAATLIFNAALINFKTFFYTLFICITSGALGGILGIGLSDNSL
ncbi:MAG: TIGR04086 family membrane protein [Syntrophomonadaceae bacterium]|nr:TIGR04086 family membrane protein [Syntrophomonadaceae bacterium]MDD3890295.1 TIGR04086 family membrane protein [Syntrophomonadaceae bacterium]MDD4549459.1 TIGR04086 family membrane protein [Syntrophomonadaceae bacterium]